MRERERQGSTCAKTSAYGKPAPGETGDETGDETADETGGRDGGKVAVGP